MADLLDANWLRACAFGAASLAMVWAWRFERDRSERVDDARPQVAWPIFWLMTGAVYASMAVALGIGLAGTLGGIGRDYARSGQWYESRRPLQAAAVLLIGLVWLTVIVVGIWRVPERRRRYLPSALLCTSLVFFSIIRLISFHYVDTVLVRTSVIGVPLGTVVELIGIIAAVILAATAARRPVDGSAGRPGVQSTAPVRPEI